MDAVKVLAELLALAQKLGRVKSANLYDNGFVAVNGCAGGRDFLLTFDAEEANGGT